MIRFLGGVWISVWMMFWFSLFCEGEKASGMLQLFKQGGNAL